MSKHIFYNIAIFLLAIVCIVDYLQINKLQQELANTRDQIEAEVDALDGKLDASIYKKDAQMLLLNRNYGNANVHKLLADSCYNDCMKYRTKYGKDTTE